MSCAITRYPIIRSALISLPIEHNGLTSRWDEDPISVVSQNCDNKLKQTARKEIGGNLLTNRVVISRRRKESEMIFSCIC